MSVPASLSAIWDKVGAFFDRALGAHPGAMRCAAGCADCCAPDLTVTELEAVAIAEFVNSLDESARARLLANRSARLAATAGRRCPALGPDERCGIYPVRPLVCRTHGLVIKLSSEAEDAQPADERRHLPVLDACPKNFVGMDLTEVAPSAVLDQRTLSTLLYVANRAAGLRDQRVALAELLVAEAD